MLRRAVAEDTSYQVVHTPFMSPLLLMRALWVLAVIDPHAASPELRKCYIGDRSTRAALKDLHDALVLLPYELAQLLTAKLCFSVLITLT